MRKTLLFALLSLFSLQLVAQTCDPDPMYADTTFGVFPSPFDSLTMTGGIESSACINKPYEFILTAVIPDTLAIMGFEVALNNVTIATTGAVTGLPNGITYACNPPSCVFEGGTNGCIVLYGTADDSNMPGDYPLIINMIVDSDLLALPTTFPGDLFPGSYALKVEPESSTTCSVVSTTNLLKENLVFSNSPNPFADFTQIKITSGISQEVDFQVANLLGKQVHYQTVNLLEGDNTIDFDSSDMPNGIYIYSLKKGSDIISKKMIVQR